MTVIHGEEWYKYHIISTEDVKNHGIKKAAIMGNLDKLKENQELHEAFPYIEKDEFYQLLEEMIKDGILKRTQKVNKNGKDKL